MNIVSPRNGCFIALALAVAAPAHAHGGLGSLRGLLILLLLLIGVGGLVLVGLMIPAIRAGIRNDALSKWGTAGVVLGGFYAFCGLMFYSTVAEEEWAKFPGLVAAIALTLLLVYVLRDKNRLRTGALIAIGITTVALLVTPAKTWKGNVFDMIETVYVDNSADLLEPVWINKPNDKRHVLNFADGSSILQFERMGEAGEIGDLFSSVPGDRVLLEKLETTRKGDWFKVTHYEIDPRYERIQRYVWAQPRHSLIKRSANMYRPKKQSSIGVRMNIDADVDYRALLLHTLNWSDIRPLKNSLVLAGKIDVNEQSFVDQAFEKEYSETYRFLITQGIDVNAINSDGESMLHRAAEIADAGLMRLLISRGADITVRNKQGLDPLQYYIERHSDRAIAMRPFIREFPEAAPELSP